MRGAIAIGVALGMLGCGDLFGLDEVSRGADGSTTTTTSSTSTESGDVGTGGQGGDGGSRGSSESTSTLDGSGGAGGSGAGGTGSGGGFESCPLPWEELDAAEDLVDATFPADVEPWQIYGAGEACTPGGDTCLLTLEAPAVQLGYLLGEDRALPSGTCLTLELDAEPSAAMNVFPVAYDRVGSVAFGDAVELAPGGGPLSTTCTLRDDTGIDAVGFTMAGDAGDTIDLVSAKVTIAPSCDAAPPCDEPDDACGGEEETSIDVRGAPPEGFGPQEGAYTAAIGGYGACEATRIAPPEGEGLALTAAAPDLPADRCLSPVVYARGDMGLEVWLRSEAGDTIRFSFDVDGSPWARFAAAPCSVPEGFDAQTLELVTHPSEPACSYVDLDRIDLVTSGAACDQACATEGP